MPQFNASSALLFKRFVESGVTSPEELADVMGNASVETGSFSTMDEQLKGYHSIEQVVGAVRSAGTRHTRDEIQAAVVARRTWGSCHSLKNRQSRPIQRPPARKHGLGDHPDGLPSGSPTVPRSHLSKELRNERKTSIDDGVAVPVRCSIVRCSH